MPVNLSDTLVFTELQVGERLILLEIVVCFVAKHPVNVYQLVIVI